MKYLITVALLAAATPAAAQTSKVVVNGTTHEDSIVRVIDRVEVKKSTFHILNRKQDTAMLVRDGAIVVQLTDKGLKHMKREIKKEGESALGKILHAAMAGAVAEFLDHGMEYQLSDLKQARYENGAIVLIRKSGERVFEDMEINGEQVMESFSRADSERFVAHVNKLIR